MTRQGRSQKIEAFGRAPEVLAAALRQFPKKMWMYRPASNRWSIHEMILHLADHEANAYIRCRRLIAEPGKPVLSYDPSVWAGALGYFHQSTRGALDVLRLLRRMTYELVAALPDSVWSNSAEYTENAGANLEEWLDLQERYIPQHIEQMKENYAIWLQSHPPRQSPARAPKHSPGIKMMALNASV